MCSSDLDSEKVNYGQLLNYTAEMLGVFAFVVSVSRLTKTVGWGRFIRYVIILS